MMVAVLLTSIMSAAESPQAELQLGDERLRMDTGSTSS